MAARQRLPGLACAVLTSLLVACSGDPSDPGETVRSGVDELEYVGAQACAECHPRQMAAWRGSHHDLAMQEAASATVLGSFDDAAFSYSGVTTTFSRDGTRFLVHTDGPDGQPDQYEILYTFGVEPLQQYLVALPGGRLQALSIAWDARPPSLGGQRWFHLYPEESIDHLDELHWTRRTQNWNYMCAECHSTNLQKNYDSSAGSYATTWSEIDVSCEACHGPASGHLEWVDLPEGRRTGGDAGFTWDLDAETGVGWIMDAATGIARRAEPRVSHSEIQMCARCHSRRSVLTSRYRHGRPLVDTHRPALLEQDLYHPDGQILDEVYVYGSFLQSRMYRAGVTCSDCHDPHSTNVRGSPNEVCARCHDPATFRAANHDRHVDRASAPGCVDCHMPARDYMVVDPRRDHSFRVPDPALTVAIGTPNACDTCHAEKGAAWSAAALRDWAVEPPPAQTWARALDAAARGLPGAEQLLLGVVENTELPAIVRATAAQRLGHFPGPVTYRVLDRAVRDVDPLVRLGALGGLDSADLNARVHLAAQLLSDPALAVRIEAASVMAPVPDEVLTPEQLALRASAVEEFRAAQLVNADHPAAHLNLGSLSARAGDLATAEVHYRTALELDPGFAPALVNLADIAREQQRDDDGERLLREAVRLAPDNAQAHHALGLLLVRRGRQDEAIASLRRAVELEPDTSRFSYVLGVALHSSNRTAEALEALTAIHARRPGDRDVLWALATIHRDAGELEQARTYARALVAEAPLHQGARQLLDQLLTK